MKNKESRRGSQSDAAEALPERAAEPDAALAPKVLELDSKRFVKTIFWTMVGLELFGMALDYFVNYRRWTPVLAMRRWADISSEQSLSSWMAITQTFMVGLTLWLIVVLVGREPAVKRWRVAGWSILALFFTYMAMDDGTRFHEGMGSVFSYLFNRDAEEGQVASLGMQVAHSFPSYYWQVVFVPPFAAVGLFMLWFIWREIREPRMLWLTVAALGFLATAVGLDFVEGLDEGHPWNLWSRLASPALDLITQRLYGEPAYETLVHFSQSVEETFEMFGNTLFWVVFLNYLTTRTGTDFRVRFLPPQQEGSSRRE